MQKTLFHTKGANAGFSQVDINIEALDCEILHIGYILLLDALYKSDDKYGTKMARLLHDIKAKGVKTAIDVVSEEGNRFVQTVYMDIRRAKWLGGYF